MNDLLKMDHQMEENVPPPFAPLSIMLTFFIQHSFIQQIFIKYLHVPSLGTEVTNVNIEIPLRGPSQARRQDLCLQLESS